MGGLTAVHPPSTPDQAQDAPETPTEASDGPVAPPTTRTGGTTLRYRPEAPDPAEPVDLSDPQAVARWLRPRPDPYRRSGPSRGGPGGWFES